MGRLERLLSQQEAAGSGDDRDLAKLEKALVAQAAAFHQASGRDLAQAARAFEKLAVAYADILQRYELFDQATLVTKAASSILAKASAFSGPPRVP